MRRLLALFASLFLSVPGAAQTTNRVPPINLATSNPSGTSCSVADTIEQHGPAHYVCSESPLTWIQVSPLLSKNLSDIPNGPALIAPLGAASSSLMAPPSLVGSISAPPVNSIMNPCNLPGSTADVQLSAAAALVSNYGTIDARCYGTASVTIAATANLGANLSSGYGKVIKWLFSPGTTFVPSSCGITMFNLFSGSSVQDLHVDVTSSCPSVTSWTGIVLRIFPASNAEALFYQHELLEGLWFNANPFGTTGTGILVGSSSANQEVAMVKFANFTLNGFSDCIDIETSGTGYVNNNWFQGHTNCQKNAMKIGANGNGGVASKETFTGNYINLVMDGTTNGVVTSGNGNVQANIFILTVADLLHPWNPINSNTVGNFVIVAGNGATVRDNGHNEVHLYDGNPMQLLDPLVLSIPSGLTGPGFTIKGQGTTGTVDNYFELEGGVAGGNTNMFSCRTNGTGEVDCNTQNSALLGLGVNSGANGGSTTRDLWIDSSQNVHVNGSNVVYRCTTSGMLPAGALTINPANCGVSVSTTLQVQ